MGHGNVVLFITDGHRNDMLGCCGNTLLDTPNIDGFAARSRRFRNAFCTHTVCMPTRASIFTGRYPHIHGVWANGVALPTSAITLPAVLADHGYATCAAGKVHFEPQQAYEGGIAPDMTGCAPYYGFDEVHLSENSLGQEYLDFIDSEFPDLSEQARARRDLPEEAHELHWITSRTIDFIHRQVAADRPFFASCSFHELCPPSHPPRGYAGRHAPETIPIPELRDDDLAAKPPFYRECYEGYRRLGRQPDEATLRSYIASSYDQTEFIDAQFGRLLDVLNEVGIADDTAVLFTADHGLSLNDHFQWRHGPFLFDEVVNVPMIWHLPTVGKPGVEDALVEGVDIMPTVLDWCGVEIPAGVQGQSLVPLIRDDADACGRESVLLQECEAPDLAARGLDPKSVTQWAVRTQAWKLIHYPGRPYGELYDLEHDPGEFTNLWCDPAYADRRSAMQLLLLDRLCEARDPLPARHHDW